ncbi:hypothetical protein RS130_01440 [Paraglaciecola aquimarina]|uniref:Lipoprotein n=1 Tax=Paraglaciecola aquimarina TaxID=1235557 RepID=A0ABU3SRW9_9ALTE|nr:hypothetical protein [Paraglaciecola aquimarina]MDU0352760.1 hypothetical protein [Paraglaciecola aquimarina]
MKLTIVLVMCFVAFSGCTVLGLATDLALFKAMDKGRCENSDYASCNVRGQEVLIFTVEGAKQDAKIVKALLAEMKTEEPNVATEDPLPNPLKPKLSVCKKVVAGKQKCYPADYYKDMYMSQ